MWNILAVALVLLVLAIWLRSERAIPGTSKTVECNADNVDSAACDKKAEKIVAGLSNKTEFKIGAPDPDIGAPDAAVQQLPRPENWQAFTANEKLEWIKDEYFRAPEEVEKAQDDTKKIEYIRSLPRSRDCDDHFADCGKFAAAGDCKINPEFMLTHCASSCESCKLSVEQRYRASEILNSINTECTYHGESYPSV